jgi:hypothetical protein
MEYVSPWRHYRCGFRLIPLVSLLSSASANLSLSQAVKSIKGLFGKGAIVLGVDGDGQSSCALGGVSGICNMAVQPNGLCDSVEAIVADLLCVTRIILSRN